MTPELVIYKNIKRVKYNCQVCQKECFKSIAHFNRNKNHFCSTTCYKIFINPFGEKKLQGKTGIESAHYMKIHVWINKQMGKAEICDKCNGVAKRYEWALKEGCKYEKNIENFIQLCPSCHRKQDDTFERRQKISDALKGRKPNNTRKVKLTYIKTGRTYEFESIVLASKELEISRTSIANVLSNRTKTAGGYLCHYL